MSKLKRTVDDLKEDFYWQFIFPRLDYTKKNFDKEKIGNGVLFIRKKREVLKE